MSAKNDLLAYIREHIDEMSDDHAAQLQKMAERLVKLKHNGGVVKSLEGPARVTLSSQTVNSIDLSKYIVPGSVSLTFHETGSGA